MKRKASIHTFRIFKLEKKIIVEICLHFLYQSILQFSNEELL